MNDLENHMVLTIPGEAEAERLADYLDSPEGEAEVNEIAYDLAEKEFDSKSFPLDEWIDNLREQPEGAGEAIAQVCFAIGEKQLVEAARKLRAVYFSAFVDSRWSEFTRDAIAQITNNWYEGVAADERF